MNVYDFDKTIYDGDSTAHFVLFCIKKQPSLLRYLPIQGVAYLSFLIKLVEKTAFKQTMYMFFSGIKDIDSYVDIFWALHEQNLKKWYLDQKKPDDVIISASPEFLLKPICQKLGVELMASRVDKKNGVYDGLNCYGEEKVRRFYEKYDGVTIDEFYSDSYSDDPLAKISKKSFLVDKDKLLEWKA